MDTSIKKIKVTDLAQSCIDHITHTINFSTVAITGHNDKIDPLIHLHGSGTLVSIGNKYGILTAQHVWHAINNSRDVCTISISCYGKNRWVFDKKSYFIPYNVNENIDICFLEIPVTILGRLKAISSFIPLNKCLLPPAINYCLLAFAGFPSESMPVEQIAYEPIYYFFSKPVLTQDDYEMLIELNSELHPSTIQDFGGLSGGGVWGFLLQYSNIDNGVCLKLDDRDTYLIGVCYYQMPLENGKGRIKAVGPMAINKLLINVK